MFHCKSDELCVRMGPLLSLFRVFADTSTPYANTSQSTLACPTPSITDEVAVSLASL